MTTPDPAARPIGIFDSGIGGLTVARAVAQRLPHERLVYFGDTAHLPYGEKSTAAIQAYSVKICDVLLRQHCKLILIACNSASAAAYELVREYVGSKAVVVGMIDPVAQYIGQHYAGRPVGLIGTKQTVGSNSYRKKIDQLDLGVDLHQLATPLLIPMIEEGFFNGRVSEEISAPTSTTPRCKASTRCCSPVRTSRSSSPRWRPTTRAAWPCSTLPTWWPLP